MDIMSPLKEEEPASPSLVQDESSISTRMAFQKKMFLYANLILLHRPYVNDVLTTRNTSNRPSYDICSYAAIIITDTASKLNPTELVYHSKSPLFAYALVMALRIHIMNATNANPEKYNAHKNFNLCLATLSRLPQAKNTCSMLHEALIDLEEQYTNRFLLAQEREDDIKLQQQLQQQMQLHQPVITAAQVVFSPGATDKRKDRPNSDASQGLTFNTPLEPGTGRLVIKHHNQPTDSAGRKKKKNKIVHDTPAMFVDSQQCRQKQKQKQSQQKLQGVFSTNGYQHASAPPTQSVQVQQQQQLPPSTQFSQGNHFQLNDSYTQYTTPSSSSTSSSSHGSATFPQTEYTSMVPHYADTMFPLNDAFDQVLNQMNSQETSMSLNFTDLLPMNDGMNALWNTNFSNEMPMYCVAPREDTFGVSITRTSNKTIPPNDTNLAFSYPSI
ncbi:uncharacterized protein B0P05DRAFT_233195 [Gilbertella persicaria]|uniref:uncharacterized protein n=1 Tax=Gilbertella persicaria TaxID=101096 RepID=UPI00221ED67B|nr:uncharacterized protein B0P05DRAFT_233195 [Gilbertella persicaria]KAI8064297.1 hypothetical protein B0P05DRAFT_233195 [Gilbertella persicaria]